MLSELHDSCKLRNNHIFFIIDGLNEFSGTNVDTIEIYRFIINFCRTIYGEHLHCFKVIITCRDSSFFYYMNQAKMSPGLNEFMNFIESNSLEPLPYYRVKALSNEEISSLCNVYFTNDEENHLFQRFVKSVDNNANLLPHFLLQFPVHFHQMLFVLNRRMICLKYLSRKCLPIWAPNWIWSWHIGYLTYISGNICNTNIR